MEKYLIEADTMKRTSPSSTGTQTKSRSPFNLGKDYVAILAYRSDSSVSYTSRSTASCESANTSDDIQCVPDSFALDPDTSPRSQFYTHFEKEHYRINLKNARPSCIGLNDSYSKNCPCTELEDFSRVVDGCNNTSVRSTSSEDSGRSSVTNNQHIFSPIASSSMLDESSQSEKAERLRSFLAEVPLTPNYKSSPQERSRSNQKSRSFSNCSSEIDPMSIFMWSMVDEDDEPYMCPTEESIQKKGQIVNKRRPAMGTRAISRSSRCRLSMRSHDILAGTFAEHSESIEPLAAQSDAVESLYDADSFLEVKTIPVTISRCNSTYSESDSGFSSDNSDIHTVPSSPLRPQESNSIKKLFTCMLNPARKESQVESTPKKTEQLLPKNSKKSLISKFRKLSTNFNKKEKRIQL